MERMSVQAERAYLEVHLYCPDDLPNVIADPPGLGQALVNLLHNAIKFTPEGGEIVLVAWHQGEVIVFSVEDTGVGIPADDLPRIFERFLKSRSGSFWGWYRFRISHHPPFGHRPWRVDLGRFGRRRGKHFFFLDPQCDET